MREPLGRRVLMAGGLLFAGALLFAAGQVSARNTTTPNVDTARAEAASSVTRYLGGPVDDESTSTTVPDPTTTVAPTTTTVPPATTAAPPATTAPPPPSAAPAQSTSPAVAKPKPKPKPKPKAPVPKPPTVKLTPPPPTAPPVTQPPPPPPTTAAPAPSRDRRADERAQRWEELRKWFEQVLRERLERGRDDDRGSWGR